MGKLVFFLRKRDIIVAERRTVLLLHLAKQGEGPIRLPRVRVNVHRSGMLALNLENLASTGIIKVGGKRARIPAEHISHRLVALGEPACERVLRR